MVSFFQGTLSQASKAGSVSAGAEVPVEGKHVLHADALPPAVHVAHVLSHGSNLFGVTAVLKK